MVLCLCIYTYIRIVGEGGRYVYRYVTICVCKYVCKFPIIRGLSIDPKWQGWYSENTQKKKAQFIEAAIVAPLFFNAGIVLSTSRIPQTNVGNYLGLLSALPLAAMSIRFLRFLFVRMYRSLL